MDLERLIEEAQAGGTLDSSGRFTIDLERAWEKLGKWSLERPVEFILNLVRGAVGSGAAWVRINEGRGKLSFEFPEEVPGPGHLFDRPFAEGPVWLKELARGIVLALSGGFASRAVLSSGSERLEVWLEGASPRSELVPRLGAGPTTLVFSLRPRWLGSGARAMVQRECWLAPCQLTWNGRAVTREIPVAGLLGWRVIRSSQPLPGIGLRFAREGPTVMHEHPGEAFVGLARDKGFTRCVNHGVCEDHGLEEAFTGARIWFTAPPAWQGLRGILSIGEPIVEAAFEVALQLAIEHKTALSPQQLVELVAEHEGAVETGLQALREWPESHPHRPQLLLMVVWALLRKRDFAEAEKLVTPLATALLKPPTFLQRLRRQVPYLDLACFAQQVDQVAENCPEEAMRWLERLAGWTARLGKPIARQGLAELALRFQRNALAERIALELMQANSKVPLTRARALGLGLPQKRFPEMLLLMRSLAPHSRTRLSDQLVAQAPEELKAAACEQAADSYRWAAQRYNDHALFELAQGAKTFQWRGQYLKRADGLYVEALRRGADPVRLGRSRARGAALVIEGLVRASQLLTHHRQRFRAACERQLARFLERSFDDPEVRLLEAGVRAELGELEQARALLDAGEADPPPGEHFRLLAVVERGILQRLSGREEAVDLTSLAILPSRAKDDRADFMLLLLRSRDLPPVPEGLAGRLIRLAALSDDRSRRLQLLRYALLVQFRFLGHDSLSLGRPPSATRWLTAF